MAKKAAKSVAREKRRKERISAGYRNYLTECVTRRSTDPNHRIVVVEWNTRTQTKARMGRLVDFKNGKLLLFCGDPYYTRYTIRPDQIVQYREVGLDEVVEMALRAGNSPQGRKRRLGNVVDPLEWAPTGCI